MTKQSICDLRDMICVNALSPEVELVTSLADEAAFDSEIRAEISNRTETLVRQLRDQGSTTFLQSFLGEYGLSTEEGIALMSMAEAFLRVPDASTLDELIAEKITGSNWQSHSGQASSFLVNASTWALMLTGRLLTEDQHAGLIHAMRDLLRRFGEPVVRIAMTETMEQLGSHFVVGENIQSAVSRTQKDKRYDDYYFSFDMLGESALTDIDASAYFDSYKAAITELAKHATDDIQKSPGISVKLSALHPRFELLQRSRSFDLLLDRMSELTAMAAASNLNLNIDGEEAERMEFTLDIFAALVQSSDHPDWRGLGLVVQTYSRNSCYIIDWLNELAEQNKRRFMVRLVKGAYWDSEIKWSQLDGLVDYPVFTSKAATDVSYIACAKYLLANRDVLFPQFATHNAHTVATILEIDNQQTSSNRAGFEFQRLHGMGESLYTQVIEEQTVA